jgi:hypothetical protein
MRIPHSAFIVLTALASLASACNGTVDGGVSASEDPLLRSPGPILLAPKNHSFLPFQSWGERLTAEDGFTNADTPVLFGKVNADSKDDFIGFGYAGVYVGFSNGTGFSAVNFVLKAFGTDDGWSAAKHVRLVGDINNDGLADIVGFGNDGVWTALSNGAGFGPVHFVQADLGYNQGWRVDKHVRVLADVNGDHFKDIVAFGDAGVYVAFGDGAGGFGTPRFLVAEFGAQQGWTNANHIRTTVDLNGDGREDLVGFGAAGVWTALSNGTSFAAPRFVLADFGYNQGWTVARNPRFFADMDGDGHKDIVGFGAAGLYTARSNVDGTFGVNRFVYADCGPSPYKTCVVADLNGDGYGDLLAHTGREWGQVLGPSLPYERRVLYGQFPDRWTTADVDGNGMADVVAFNYDQIRVARSTDAAPASPPTTPVVTYVDDPTSSSLTFHWTDSSHNETGFEIEYYTDPNEVFGTQWPAPANTTSTVFTGLDASTKYCYRIRAINDFTYSSWTGWACGTTLDATPPTSGTWTEYMNEDPPPVSGVVTYSARWYPQGRSIARFRSAYTNGDQILFVKPGFSPDSCYSNPSGVISLPSNGSLTALQVSQISWHNSDGSVDFHGCLGEVQPSQNVVPSLVFNLDWTQ